MGSGFSLKMGLPLAQGVNARFKTPIIGKLLQHSSGEWQWVYDNGKVALNNGKLSSRVVPFEYLFETFVKEYIASHGEFDYEDFYQWVVDLSKAELDKIYALTEKLMTSHTDDESYLKRLKAELSVAPYDEIYSCLNHLIADMLTLRTEDYSAYQSFISIVSRCSPLNIFSLNHDCVIEYLFKVFSIPFSDGFSASNSCIVGDTGNPLKIFQSDFSEEVSLLKLHGGINIYKFEYRVPMPSDKPRPPTLVPTGDCEYFKAGYRDKHYVKFIDANTGVIIQEFNSNIAPQLLTGTNKAETIRTDKMFGALYSEFSKRVNQTEILCVVGYSYRDEHINEQLCSAIQKGTLKRIININPDNSVPLSCDLCGVDIRYYSSIEDLDIEDFQ